MTDKRRSVLFVFLASVCFSAGGLFIKLIPWSALAINGARNLIGAAVIGTYLLITRHRIVFSSRVLTGALAMIGVTTFFTISNKLTTAANTIVLQFTAPVFVILMMAVFYHQKPRRLDVITCVLVMLGVVLFFVDGIRENADAISSCFLGQLAAGLAMTPLCFGETDFTAQTLAAVIALGVIQVGGAYVLFSIGIKNTPPVTASLITGLEPIMNPLLVAVFYGETVSTLSIIGSVIVVCTIMVYNFLLARKDH